MIPNGNCSYAVSVRKVSLKLSDVKNLTHASSRSKWSKKSVYAKKGVKRQRAKIAGPSEAGHCRIPRRAREDKKFEDKRKAKEGTKRLKGVKRQRANIAGPSEAGHCH